VIIQFSESNSLASRKMISNLKLQEKNMFSRILRLLGTALNAYSFYSNPIRFLATLFAVLIIPYLAYIFWGAVVIIVLAVFGIYFIYEAIRPTISNKGSHHH